MNEIFAFVGWLVLVAIALGAIVASYACSMFATNGNTEGRVLLIVGIILWVIVFKTAPFKMVAA